MQTGGLATLRQALAVLVGRGQARALPPAPLTYPVVPRGEPLSAPVAPRAPVAGGYYLNADGSGAHNANGDPVPVHPDDEAQALALRTRAAMRAVYQAEAFSLADAQEIADEAPVEAAHPRMAKAAPAAPPGEPDGA